MTDYRSWLVAGCFLLAGWLLYPALAGTTSRPVTDADLQEFTYVCRESGETFRLLGRSAPAAHPTTGRLTLWPALYCEQCQKWSISGPIDSLQARGRAPVCPVHNVPMSIHGPAK